MTDNPSIAMLPSNKPIDNRQLKGPILARPLRIEYKDAFYHVTSRGDNKIGQLGVSNKQKTRGANEQQ